MNDATLPAVTSVAEEEGNLKRSIQMKNFLGKETRREVMGLPIGAGRPLGQIIGQIFAVKEKNGTLPDGATKLSLLGMGEFEGMNYETGEVFTSTAAYLPGYYLETVQSMFERDKLANAIEFAVEIWLVATGKSIPVAYEVRNLIRRRPDNPLNKMKAEMAAAGRLRLPAPSPAAALIEGEVREMPAIEEVASETAIEEPDSDDALDTVADGRYDLGEGDAPVRLGKGKAAKAA